MGCTIIGCGRALPELVVSNDDISEYVETSNEWIVERTGIESRHIAVRESCLELACEAARNALGWSTDGWTAESSPMSAESIDLVICCTMTPDMLVPSQAALIKKELGLSNAIAFDLNSACAGFIYGLEMGHAFLSSRNAATSDLSAGGSDAADSRKSDGVCFNDYKRALIVGVDRLSHIVDWTDRSTCILFGDGAGAVVLDWQDDHAGIISSFLKNTDDPGHLTAPHLYDLSTIPYKDSTSQADEAENDKEASDDEHFLSMNGREVFKFASNALVEALEEALSRANLETEDIATIIPHQANERIVRYAAKKGKIPMSLFHLTISQEGNTSAASIPMAMADAYRKGRIKTGDKVALLGFGGGLASGAIIFESV